MVYFYIFQINFLKALSLKSVDITDSKVRESERERERKAFFSCVSPYGYNDQRWARLKPGGLLFQVSHVGAAVLALQPSSAACLGSLARS